MIKNLERRARLPRLGVIRLGVKAQNAAGKEYPKEVDYFVVPDDLGAKLGDRQPKRIAVLFPFDDPYRVLSADYVLYNSANLLQVKCDGERCTRIGAGPKGADVVEPCRRVLPDDGKASSCECGAKPMARLNVIVLNGPVGVYQVLIGGEQRIADLLSELVIFKRTLGRLTDIIFEIERTPTETQIKKADGGRLARTGWPVHVRCAFTAKQALEARGIDQLALPAQAEQYALEEHDDEVAPDVPETVPPGAAAATTPVVPPAAEKTPPRRRQAPQARTGASGGTDDQARSAPPSQEPPARSEEEPPHPAETATTATGRTVDTETGEVIEEAEVVPAPAVAAAPPAAGQPDRTELLREIYDICVKRIGMEPTHVSIVLSEKWRKSVADLDDSDLPKLLDEHTFLMEAKTPAATAQVKATYRVLYQKAMARRPKPAQA